jgi:hypothetical protein
MKWVVGCMVLVALPISTVPLSACTAEPTPVPRRTDARLVPPDARGRRVLIEAVEVEGPISIEAQNIEIVADRETITLRGLVATPREKALLGRIAQRSAGTKRIRNELECPLDSHPEPIEEALFHTALLPRPPGHVGRDLEVAAQERMHSPGEGSDERRFPAERPTGAGLRACRREGSRPP